MAAARMDPRRPAAVGPARDRGVSIIEYAAVIVLAGTVLGLCLVAIPGTLRPPVADAVCYLMGLGDECGDDGGGASPDTPDPSGPPSVPPECRPPGSPRPETEDDKKYKPKLCEKYYKKEWSKVTTKILFIRMSDEFAFIRQEYSDGSVRLTGVSTKGIGVELEGDLNVVKSGGISLGGKIGGKLTWGVGDTFVFDGPNAKAEADRREQYIKTYLEMSHSPPVGCPGGPQPPPGLGGGSGGAPPRDCPGFIDPGDFAEEVGEPEITTESLGGEGSLGLNFGKGTAGGKGKDGKEDKDAKKGSLSLNLLGGEGKLSGETIEETDKRDPDNPKYSRTYSFTTEGDGTVGFLNFRGAKNVAMKVTRDKDGKLLAVTLAESAATPDGAGFKAGFAGDVGTGKHGIEGGYETTERDGFHDSRVATLEVGDDNRDLIEGWLEGKKSGEGNRAGDIGAPVELDDKSSEWDKVAKEFYDHGRVSKTLFDTEQESSSASFGVNLYGVGLGYTIEWGKEEREAIDSHYLGAPNGKDPRDWIEFPECEYTSGGDGDSDDPKPSDPPPGRPEGCRKEDD
ncbi:hypothetical protein CLV63_102103 [Murinocardiopsis flavida]|uniref:Uncharacterized protein n=1 Tax=Murinocardiopsis flavida TaxID=645275 RepID=A0A2P8DRY4_9ACTN|nr:hypothetical protein [Murinocardiopsis flavida]PSK99976.1 hypothetical protein CLV63_102103 [Murinocardiopsis flavida]